MTDPTLGFTISIDAPEDFNVDVYFGHRCNKDEETAAEHIHQIPPTKGRTRMWQAEIALLTWHSFRIEWKPSVPDPKAKTFGPVERREVAQPTEVRKAAVGAKQRHA